MAGQVLVRADPATAGMDYMSSILVDGGSWTQELSLLVSPLVIILLLTVLGLMAIDRYLKLQRVGSE